MLISFLNSPEPDPVPAAPLAPGPPWLAELESDCPMTMTGRTPGLEVNLVRVTAREDAAACFLPGEQCRTPGSVAADWVGLLAAELE